VSFVTCAATFVIQILAGGLRSGYRRQ